MRHGGARLALVWIGALVGCTGATPGPASTDPDGGSAIHLEDDAGPGDAGFGPVDAGPWSEPQPTPYARQAAPNPIVVENQRPGDWDWYIGHDAQDHEIEGYASDVSTEAGGTLGISVSTSINSEFTYAVYRLGDYGGVGARKVQLGETLQGKPRGACPMDPATSRVECNWPVSFTLTIPPDWVSGEYLVKLHRADGFERYVPFVIRDHRAAELLFKASVNTYQAYNAWQGESLYQDASHTRPSGRAFEASFDRPYYDGAGSMNVLWWEQHMVRFLEHAGYDVTYGTSVDVYRFAGFYAGIGAVVTAGHDEYWTQRERDLTDAALDSGATSFMNLTANPAYWRVRLEPDSQGRPYRTVVCYKNDQDEDPELELGAPTTSRFRDPPDAQPENGLYGTQYENWMLMGYPLVIGSTSDPLFANTGFQPGDVVPGLVGYEYDNVQHNGFTPAGLHILASSPLVNAEGWPSTSQVVHRTTASGTTVFSSGSIYWPLALSSSPGMMDVRIWRLTWNALEDALAHRRAPRPPPTFPEVIRADVAPDPCWARSVSALAGDGTRGERDGPAAQAQLEGATGIAVGADGTIYLADSPANVIRQIKGGVVTTIAGGIDGDLDGPGAQARFRVPEGLAIGPDGALYIADSDNHQIRRMTLDASHTVTTLAGSVTRSGGYQDGPGATARFNRPVALTVAPDGTIYVVDEENSLIRAIAPDAAHTVRTVAGTYAGDVDGPSLAAAFNYPTAIARGPDGTLYVLDTGNTKVKRLTLGAQPMVDTIAGGGAGFADGTGDVARFRPQAGLLWTRAGLVVSDAANHRLRLITVGATAALTRVRTLVGSGKAGATLGPGRTATLAAPAGLALGPDGTIYMSDSGNFAIRAVMP